MNLKVGANNKILNVIILLIFIALSVFVGNNHEPWADEAQSWLIARDASIYEIIFNVARYEGTPVLWQILLKFLITLGLEYKYFYVVPVFFSSIGIWIIVDKLKIPNLLKILLPFTYFILYEYTIKARSYCLLLPVLAAIAWIYENRKTYVFLYNFLLGILATICLHGAIISGVLYLFEMFEILKELKEFGKIKTTKKEVISIILLSLLYIFIIILIFPTPDLYVSISIENAKQWGSITTLLYWFIKILEAFVSDYCHLKVLLVPSIIFVFLLMLFALKDNKNKKVFLSVFLTVTAFICFIRISNHHIGLIFYTFVFSLYLVKDEIGEKSRKILYILFILMFIIQIIWSIKTIVLEKKYAYSASKEVAEYIKTLKYEELDIYASGYYSVSILPYFEKNIYDNDRGGKTYYIWSLNNLDWYRSSSKEYIYPEDLNKNPDIIILHNNYSGKGYRTLIEKVRKTEEYKETVFYGNDFYKGNIDKYKNPDNEGFYVFERIK